VARASTWDGARRLKADGAGEVVRPELEGGVEIVRRTLRELRLPMREIQRYTDLVRREGLEESKRPSLERSRGLDDLVHAAGDLELGWLVVGDTSPLSGVRIVDASLRQTVGVSVVAIAREHAVISNPGPDVIFVPGDRVALIGTPEQVAAAEGLFEPAG
jgi:K+:H+ antiporter